MIKKNSKLKIFLQKRTLIDWLFVSLLVVIPALLLFFFRTKTEVITIEFKVAPEELFSGYDINPNLDYASRFKVGDQEYDELGNSVAKIVEVTSLRVEEGRSAVFLKIEVEAKFNFRKNTYFLKNKPVIYGEEFSFNFTKVRFMGIVINPKLESEDAQEWLRVKAQLKYTSRYYSDVDGVPPYVATAIKIGDAAYTPEGKKIAEILNVEVKPARRTVVLPTGQVVESPDPFLKDVYYDMNILVRKVDGRLLTLDYRPVSIEIAMPMDFGDILVWPTIIELPK